MEMGTIVSWDKQEGDKLNEGDLLCEIETDKATMGFETPEEGYLAKIILPAGSKDVPLGKLLCIIVSEEGDVAAFKDFKDTGAASPPPPKAAAPTPAPAAPKPVAAQITQAPGPAIPSVPGQRIKASPFAKALAAAKGLDLASVAGTGFGGRIVAADLNAAQPASAVGSGAGAATAAAERVPSFRYTDIDLTNMRQTIAKRLTESKQQIPHYSLTVEIEMDEVLKLREELNSNLKDGKLSVNDFIVKASALSCKKVPAANSSFMDTFIREFKAVDVSVAVSTPDGLITPIVFNADSKGLLEISKNTKELAGKAREKKLQPAEFLGGTFTVSNLGMFGVDQFTAIINPPQSCILSVGRTSEIARPCKENGYRTVKIMRVTLTCDHRVVDGAVGAQWLQSFRTYLEQPHTMLL
ncbi:dihydrolipoyllysine-residue acetyltransferase component of pyruvate dehydrogenase complex, mitochondrial [Galendromus occidentalis]|uniref:Acetyltransferase component of pyruvate dehydrogenase complex n=1 Tax=Galendromus occidentalis TaxID=34638 RepID=A0AAJ6VUQ8_9ACAR|nr:dihydrolipoyllysine-residue acetyltransferase component of pyruvate dehydrogenase complex, mitochondrial [Galendromus occidentalis]